MASWSAYPAEGTVPKGCGENRLKGEFTAKGLAEKQSCCPGPAMERVMLPCACCEKSREARDLPRHESLRPDPAGQ